MLHLFLFLTVHEENLSPQKNHYNAEVRLSALKPKKTDAWLCPLAIFEPPDPSKRAMYPKDKVLFLILPFLVFLSFSKDLCENIEKIENCSV